MSEYCVKIEGKTPLLQHNPAAMLVKKVGSTKAQTDRPPHEQAANSVYRDGDLFVHPATAFRNAFISAAKKFKIGRSSAASLLAGSMSIEPAEFAILVDRNGEPLAEYDVDVRTVVLPSTQGRVVRGRAKFPVWGTLLRLNLNDTYWPGDDDLLTEIITYAGEMIGIGDGRPEKRALQFGKFTAVIEKV